MSAPKIDITLDALAYHPGDRVTGTVALGQDEKARAVRVELRYVNRYNGPATYGAITPIGMLAKTDTGETGGYDAYEDVVVVGSAQLPLEQGAHRFEFKLPDDAPPSAHDEGLPEHLRDLVDWQVRVTVDRAWGSPAEAAEEARVLSRSGQWARWGEAEPVSKSLKCSTGVWPDTRLVRPGERLTGTVVLAPTEVISAKGVRVQLERRRYDYTDPALHTKMIGPATGDPGSQKRGIAWFHPGPGEADVSGPVELAAGQTYPLRFELDLPEGLPPSFSAPHTELHWFVVAVVDPDRYTGEAEIVVYTGEEGGTALGTPQELLGPGSEVDQWVAFVTAPPSAKLEAADEEEQKRTAVRSIAHSGDPGAAEALIGLLAVDTGYLPASLAHAGDTVRHTVIESLGELDDPVVVEPLIEVLHSEAATYRGRKDVDPTDPGAVKRMARAEDSFKAAAQALGRIGGERAAIALAQEQANKANVPWIRKAAKKALKQLQAGQHA